MFSELSYISKGGPKFSMFSNFHISFSIGLGSIRSCEKRNNLSKSVHPNSYNGQIRRKLSFFDGIQKPSYGISVGIWFTRVISTLFGSKLLRNSGKSAESALFREFFIHFLLVEVILSRND